MGIFNAAILLFKRKSFWVALIILMLLKLAEVLHITVGVDVTDDGIPDKKIISTPSYIGLDSDGDGEPDYLIRYRRH